MISYISLSAIPSPLFVSRLTSQLWCRNPFLKFQISASRLTLKAQGLNVSLNTQIFSFKAEVLANGQCFSAKAQISTLS